MKSPRIQECSRSAYLALESDSEQGRPRFLSRLMMSMNLNKDS